MQEQVRYLLAQVLYLLAQVLYLQEQVLHLQEQVLYMLGQVVTLMTWQDNVVRLTHSQIRGILLIPWVGRVVAALHGSAEESPHSKERDAG